MSGPVGGSVPPGALRFCASLCDVAASPGPSPAPPPLTRFYGALSRHALPLSLPPPAPAGAPLLLDSVAALLAYLQSFGGNGGPCGAAFASGDLCYQCGQCGSDNTCVQCEACFRASDHAGHSVTFHKSGGGR